MGKETEPNKSEEYEVMKREQDNKLKATYIIGFFVFAFAIILIVMGAQIYNKYLDIIQQPEMQQFFIMTALAKSGGGATFEADCNFEDVEAFLTGHYENMKLPVVYDSFGKKIENKYMVYNDTILIYRNVTETNYVPERFDLKGLKGIHCNFKGGVLPSGSKN